MQALVGRFGGGTGFDLLTLNAEASDLTLFAKLGPGVRLSSGGLDPVAAFVGDFNGDGFTDVVVANNGDGVFAALVGGPDGPHLTGTASAADVPHPTALALADLTAGALSIFTAQEGEEAVARLTFALDFGIPAPVPGRGEPGGQRPVVTELLPLNESTLDVVATLVTGSGFPGGPAEAAAPAVGPPGEVLALLVAVSGGLAAADEAGPLDAASAGPQPPADGSRVAGRGGPGG